MIDDDDVTAQTFIRVLCLSWLKIFACIGIILSSYYEEYIDVVWKLCCIHMCTTLTGSVMFANVVETFRMPISCGWKSLGSTVIGLVQWLQCIGLLGAIYAMGGGYLCKRPASIDALQCIILAGLQNVTDHYAYYTLLGILQVSAHYITVHITAHITLQPSSKHRGNKRGDRQQCEGKGDLDGNGNYWPRRLTGIRGGVCMPQLMISDHLHKTLENSRKLWKTRTAMAIIGCGA